jgi:DNA-binding beta-propeller fold protein YncE
VFVADTGAHRILKFANGKRKAFGAPGSGHGQLSYPAGLAVQNGATGKPWVYVADQGNGRIEVFDDDGHFVKTFGEGLLNNPIGIAAAPGSRTLYVTEDPSHEISAFSPNGKFLNSFTCSDCPEGPIHRLGGGIAIRDTHASVWVFASDAYYDSYFGRVLVMDTSGAHQLTLGSDSGPNQIKFPDGVAVDPLDDTTWVVDSGAYKLLHLGPAGEVLVSYGGAGRDTLNQPHGIALDTTPRDSGKPAMLYLVNTSAQRVHIYKEAPGKLYVDTADDRAYWTENQIAVFSVKYNGIEQTCTGSTAQAKITVDPTAPDPERFTLSKWQYSGAITHDGSGAHLQMPLTQHQTGAITRAWDAGKYIQINLDISPQCEDDSHLEKSAAMPM